MQCNHCRSLMFEAETVTEGHTEQILFECPTCGRTHLSSRRLSVHESGACRGGEQREFRLKAAGVPS